MLLRTFGLLSVAVVSGCATLGGEFDAHLESSSQSVRDCARWYHALDREIEAAGVRDAQYSRVSGFPYLRIDRALVSMRERAARNEPAMQAFAERLLELDLEGRRHELDNLPRKSFNALPGMGPDTTRRLALGRTRECGRLLREIDLAKPQARSALLERASVPDDYSIGLRMLGLYPLTSIGFAVGIRRWEEESRISFRGDAAASGAGATQRVRYAPPALRPLPRSAVAALLERAQADPLGQPAVTEREFLALAATYAPSFDVAIAADYDRFGLMRWRRGADVPEVDASHPAVYVQPAYTRYGDRILLQIVYTIWFSERPPEGSIDLLAGRLDGVVWRVTLAPDGEPLVYDSIHPCGCFHLFVPTPRASVRPSPDALCRACRAGAWQRQHRSLRIPSVRRAALPAAGGGRQAQRFRA